MMKPNHLVVAALFSGVSSFAFAIGAIAIDDQVGDEEAGYGYSIGYDTKAAAQKRALSECRKHGNANCKVMVWFQECGAYASSRKHYGIGWGSTKEDAEEKALEQCNRDSCEVKVSGCEE
jgi:hypothetical protein